MHIFSHLIYIVLVYYAFHNQFSYCWFFNSKKSDSSIKTEKVSVSSEESVPFEMKVADEKFLLQAQFTKELSPLDACHHRVVLEIKETCGGLSEEELGKLAVQLLNCQSQSEGRKTYTCTKYMTIGQCTKAMDATTWNAYQIVSNRARAICYQTRQQQFRMKTESTVNQLVYSAEQQVSSMENLQKSQSMMIDTATDTLTKIKDDQHHLISQHDRLKKQQGSIQSSIALTLRDLYREKALIAASHKTFVEMKKKLDDATSMLVTQEVERANNHKEIMEDLADIRGKAKDVWHKIDENNQEVLNFQKDTKVHYVETLESLEKVNHTVSYVIKLVNDTHNTVETKLNWLLGLVGASGNRLAFVTTIVLHVMYFLLAAVSSSFLNTPTFSRVLLLLLVPLNAWSEIKQGTSLGFLAMTMFIGISISANWTIAWICYLITAHRKSVHNNLTYSEDQSSTAVQLSRNTDTYHSKCEKGLSKLEVQKLMDILQRLHDSGMLSPETPQKDLLTPADSIPEQEVPVNTPISVPGGYAERTKFIFPDPLILSSVKREGHSMMSSSMKKDLQSPRVELVKRHLLKTLTDDNEPYNQEKSVCPPTPSDTLSKTSTPCSTPVGTPKKGRPSDVLNRSSNKPQCLATTKAGMPCKNVCMDGSGFCFRHQVA